MDILIFIGCAIVIGFIGTYMTGIADRLADRTGLGEAFVGAVFLGASTSLPGITASVVSAADGFPTVALSNALGGIAAQTAFLAIADLAYKKANLEHAAASADNMMSGALLISLLAMLLVAMTGPQISFLGVHPVTPILFIAYLGGLRLIFKSHQSPMWIPRETRETKKDVPDKEEMYKQSLPVMWLQFVFCVIAVVAAGWFLVKSAETFAQSSGINESIIGGFFVAVTTSFPELVTSIAAVKRGALTLAVGGILGGNAFDTLFAAVADIAYRDGSIYHSASTNEILIISFTILMVSVLLLGLLRREKSGIANIGFESAFIIIIYIAGMLIVNFS